MSGGESEEVQGVNGGEVEGRASEKKSEKSERRREGACRAGGSCLVSSLQRALQRGLMASSYKREEVRGDELGGGVWLRERGQRERREKRGERVF